MQVVEMAKSNKAQVSYFVSLHHLLSFFHMYAAEDYTVASYILKGLQMAGRITKKTALVYKALAAPTQYFH